MVALRLFPYLPGAIALLIILASVHTYSGVNAGAYIDLPGGHWCGVEYQGNPGLFCDVD